MRAIRLAAAALSAAFFTLSYTASGWCQAYPTRTIQLIVAYAAGGTGDWLR
jgi:tripartite-type tricarboxylate transporter receptor subunit TctC